MSGSANINSLSESAVPSLGQAELCKSLEATLPDVVFPVGHTSYNDSVNSYWSAGSREVTPSCVVRARNAQDVSAAIKILKAAYDDSSKRDNVKFAVRSGGHSPEGQFSNVQDGVVFDLSGINHVRVNADKQTVDVGVGAHWRDVTSKLDPMGLGVVGGRASDVGVGGFILGGGLSFFSPRFGMACDNVDEYEIVLADGTIAQVTASTHPDLWKALKGGTGNIGVVTRMTMRTFVSSEIWAGYAYWAPWSASKVLKAFYDFNKPENFDPYAAGPILAYGYSQKSGLSGVVCNLVYTKPQKWPEPFKGFNSIWRLWSTNKIRTLTSATDEVDAWSPPNFRQFQMPTTIKNDLETLEACREAYNESLKKVKHVKGIICSLVFQPISAGITRKGDPNVLGLDTRDPNDVLIVLLISVSWHEKKDDDLVISTTREIISNCDTLAKEKGTADPWLYLNYAASGQNPIKGYGAVNCEFLKGVSKKYDPTGFFQKARKGGFKLHLD